jgi:uncharacterized protein (DUF1684 family)
MKHTFGKNALPALLITMLIGTTLGCSELPQDEPSLLRIAVTSPPTKTVYELGETLNLSGLVVTGTYVDGTTKRETVSLSNISGYNANTVGQQTLTVTIGGKTATFTVTVNNAALQSIAVTGSPTKTVYTQSEALNLSGLVVTGTYSDGTTKMETVSLDNISGYNANIVGQQTITVTIGGKTATFTVTVTATGGEAVLQSIAITSQPAKTVYVKGESLDISGLVVTGTYSDGTIKTEPVGIDNISGYNANTTGTQTVTVTVGDKTTTFTVTVNATASDVVLQSIAITGAPDKTVYERGESLNISGLVVTGTYSNGTTKAETVSLSNVRGYNANTVGTQTVTVTIGGKTATFTVTVTEPVLQSIAITGSPSKTVYVIGEALNLSGLVVTGTYSNGTTKAEPVSLDNISGYNAEATGTQTITVTVGGKTATFTVTVNPAVLQGIAITSLPSKTVYERGESLDLSGLVVTRTYSNGTTQAETVSLIAVSGYDADAPGQQTLTVTVNGYTATFTVTVNQPVLQSIAVTSLPTKIVYERGESLDLSGLVVTGTYSDGTTKTEYWYDVSWYNADSTGQQTLTVTVNGYTATFIVTVNEPVLQSIAITGSPTKTIYARGASLDLSGLAVTGTYSDGTTKTEYVYDISGYDADTLGQQTVTVTVGDKTATFTVTVKITAAFVVNVNLEDSINGIPENIVLSKTGMPASLTLEIIGDYTSYEWLLNDSETPVSTSASYTLNAADCRLGPNFLMVEVGTTNGAYYAREITFTVNK